MSRKTVLMAMTGLVLLTGLGAPALADPITKSDRQMVCVRLDSDQGREGVCVWLPIKP